MKHPKPPRPPIAAVVYLDGFTAGRAHANTELLKALRDAPKPPPPMSEGPGYRSGTQEYRDYGVRMAKWFNTVRAEALKLARGGE